MSDYAIDSMKHKSRGYDVLVALPLAFVTIFCFVFVMMHPYYKAHPATATAIVTSSNTASSAAVVDLSQPLMPLSTVPNPATSPDPSSSTSPSSTAALSLKTSTSASATVSQKTQSSLVQSTGSSTSTLQSAGTNSSNGKIKTETNPVSQLLTNLLK